MKDNLKTDNFADGLENGFVIGLVLFPLVGVAIYYDWFGAFGWTILVIAILRIVNQANGWDGIEEDAEDDE